MINYYQELRIDPGLRGDQLNDELRKLQRKWVSRTNAPDLNRRQEAERKVALIEEAKNILLDEAKRAAYDQQLQSAAAAQETIEQPAFDINQNQYVQSAAEYIQQAWELINEGRYADAIVVARTATEIEGNNADAWAVLGYADYSWGNVQDAVYEYKKAINLQPNNSVLYTDLGNIYLDNDMLDLAEDCAVRAMSIDPTNDYNKVLMGNVASAKNDYDTAIQIFSELIQVEPNNESFKQVLASNYYIKGLSYCYQDEDGYYYNIDEQATINMIDCMKKGRQYINDPEFDEKIRWGEKQLKKQFDRDKWPVFIIPFIMLLQGGFTAFLGIALTAGLGYLLMRPGWELTNVAFFGEKKFQYKIINFFNAIFRGIFAFIKGFFGK